MSIKDWFSKTKIGKYILAPFGWSEAFSDVEGELVPAYFTAVKILADNYSKLSPYVADVNNARVKNENVTKLISIRPNKYQNKQKFWGVMESNRSGKGNAYAWIKRIGGIPKELHVINPDAVIEASMATNGDVYYRIDFSMCPFIVEKNSVEYIIYEDILHFTFGDRNGIFGTRPLDVIGGNTNILGKAQKMIDSFYANNATSAMAIETTVDKAAVFQKVNETTEDFMDKYSGVENAGKPIKLPPNTKLVPIHQKFGDAQVIETQKYARGDIMNLFGIPKFMYEANDSNDSIEQQTRQFLAFTMSTVLEIYAAELEFKLMTSRQLDKGYHIIYDTEKLIETDAKTKAEVIVMQTTKGVMTPNEGARKMGNVPIDSIWGDKHWVQSQNQPIENYEIWGNNQINANGSQTNTGEESQQGEVDNTEKSNGG